MEKTKPLPGATRLFAAGKINRQVLPYLALISGTMALSLSGMFVHWADAPGTVTSFYRMLTAAVFLIPVVLKNRQRQPFPTGRGLLLPVLGGLLVALDHGVWSTSLSFTQIGTATLINNIAPLWVALFAVLAWREKMSPRFWLGMVLTLAGVVIVFGNDLFLRPHFGGGDFLALLSSLFYAAYYLVTAQARKQTATIPYVWIVTAGGAFFLFFANLALGHPLTGYSTSTYLVFLGAGLVSQIIGYFSVVYALGHLPAFIVAPSMIAQPVLTTLLAIPLAGQLLLPGQWVGGVIVLAGIYLVNKSRETTTESRS